MTTGSNTKVIDSVLSIADIHADHVKYALEELKPRMPLSESDIKNFVRADFLFFDAFIHRFSKLQDIMGSKLFTEILDYSGELTSEMSLVDKLYKLEKLNILQDAKRWQDVRGVRNHISHEYPENPELTARYLNEAIEASAYLLETLEAIKTYLSHLKKMKKALEGQS